MIRLDWIDWRTPCLPDAAARLVIRGRTNTRSCDLRRVLCVTPGRRSGRLLLHVLATQCAESGRALLPPAIVTPGDMVDVLLGLPPAPPAMMERVLAWMTVLRDAAPADLEPLLPVRPDESDPLAWHDLATVIAGLQDELAGDLLRFADVAMALREARDPAREVKRWQALATLEPRVAGILAAAGRPDPAERRRAALAGGVAATAPFDEIVLVATRELNALQRRALETFSGPITALVHAPESLAESFDAWGCLHPERWSGEPIDLPDEQIVVCDRPADQVQAALRAVAGLDGRYAARDITIGLGDESLAPSLVRGADAAGLSLHAAAGEPLARTAPARLLEIAATWRREPRFAHLAAAVRHPDLERWLTRRIEGSAADASAGVASWLTLLDRYFADHLHERLTGTWLGKSGEARQLKLVSDGVHALLEPLAGDARPLGAWAEPLLAVLRDVYGDLDDDHPAATNTVDACLALRSLLAELAALPPGLQPVVTADAAIDLVLAAAARRPLAADATADQVELLGWLELHLDPAPALVVTGVNDGHVPTSVQGDAFLPDGLRDRLGLACNRRRLARDAYLLQAIAHSRESITLIAGRHGADGAPLVPSRLLLAADGRTIARRLRWFCTDGEHRAAHPAGVPSPGAASRFVVPTLPADLAPPESMRVTDFRLYLQCPYRYALARLAGLEAFTDRAVELDPLQFGSLAHEVLEKFGQDEAARDASDAATIEEYLASKLEEIARRRFGDDPAPAVRIQIDRLRRRLGAFATCQAGLRAEGWRIVHSELSFEGGPPLDLPDQADMPLRGKIDRIDVHEDGRVRIIDYKTGEKPKSPHETHHGTQRLPADGELEWEDLQLPLYHFLWRRREPKAVVELAYLVLPRALDEVGLCPGAWTEEQLESGVERARQVVRDIRAGKLEMNREFTSPFDAFARICQTTVFQEERDEEADA